MRRALIFALSMIVLLGTVASAAAEQIPYTPAAQSYDYPETAFVTMYRVETGDSLTAIAKKYSVDWRLVAAMNNLSDPDTIYAGQELFVPITQQDVLVVNSGDTLWDIARRFEVSVEELVFVNDLENPDELFVSQKLVIPQMPVIPTFLQNQAVETLSSRGNDVPYFNWPITGTITSRFGPRRTGFHHGIDIYGEPGEVIRASAEGQVVFSGWKNSVYGNTVIINHGRKFMTLYAHNQQNLVKKGDRVDAGQTIARLGATGKTTGPHLHFEIYRNGTPVDPEKLLP